MRPLAIFLLAAPALAQSFLAGVRLGVPITGYFDTGQSGGLHGSADYSAATRRYTFGATAEWRAARAWGLELDALFHRMGYVAIVDFFDSANGNYSHSAIDVKGDSWDFPLMAKFRFGRPYLAAGGVLRYAGPVRGLGELTAGSLVAGTSTTTPLDTGDPSELRKRFYPGLTAAAGIELRTGRIRLLPEVRYTRWTANISGEGGLLRFEPNQAEFLLGVLF
jgi:outer membrane protein with beta-barrel domain